MLERLLAAAREGFVAGEVVEHPRVAVALQCREKGVRGPGVIAALVAVVRAAHRVPGRPDPDEAAQLDDRLVVILDTEVADAVDPLPGVGARADALDDDRARLLPTPVSAGSLPGLERRDETMNERPDRLLVGARHLVDDGLAGQDVALDGEPRAQPVPRPGVALGARECRRAAVRAYEAELACLAVLVLREHPLQRLLRRGAAVELGERALPVHGDARRLCRASSDACACPRDDRADGEVARLHRAAHLSGGQIGGDDRER